jgi:hypothetical protein
MAANANSTLVHELSNLSRRQLLTAAPAAALLAIIPETINPAEPADDIDGLIALLKVVSREVDRLSERTSDLYRQLPPAGVELPNRRATGPRHLTVLSREQIERHYAEDLKIWGAQVQPHIDRKIAELKEAVQRHQSARAALDLDSLDARLEKLSGERESLVNRILAAKPADLAQARRKIAAISSDIIELLIDDPRAGVDILARLV